MGEPDTVTTSKRREHNTAVIAPNEGIWSTQRVGGSGCSRGNSSLSAAPTTTTW